MALVTGDAIGWKRDGYRAQNLLRRLDRSQPKMRPLYQKIVETLQRNVSTVLLSLDQNPSFWNKTFANFLI